MLQQVIQLKILAMATTTAMMSLAPRKKKEKKEKDELLTALIIQLLIIINCIINPISHYQYFDNQCALCLSAWTNYDSVSCK